MQRGNQDRRARTLEKSLESIQLLFVRYFLELCRGQPVQPVEREVMSTLMHAYLSSGLRVPSGLRDFPSGSQQEIRFGMWDTALTIPALLWLVSIGADFAASNGHLDVYKRKLAHDAF